MFDLTISGHLNHRQRHTDGFLGIKRFVCMCLDRFSSGWLQSFALLITHTVTHW